MATPIAAKNRLPLIPIAGGVVFVLVLVAGLSYLSRRARPVESKATTEATAYLSHLSLSDVTMQASENFMKQQVIEVKGNITDGGPRALRSVDVFCIFYGLNGHEIYRERVPLLQSTGAPLRPSETRAFRLPFDALPDGWNQAIPKMVIAGISFAS